MYVSKDTLAFGRILWEKYCKNMNLYEAGERISNIFGFGLRHFFNTCLKVKILNILDIITNVPLSIHTEPNLKPKQKDH